MVYPLKAWECKETRAAPACRWRNLNTKKHKWTYPLLPFFKKKTQTPSPGWFPIGWLGNVITLSCNSIKTLGLVQFFRKIDFEFLWNGSCFHSLTSAVSFLFPLKKKKSFQPKIFKEHLTHKFSSYPFSIIQLPSHFRKESFLFADWSINMPWTIAVIKRGRDEVEGAGRFKSVYGSDCGTQKGREKGQRH